MALQLLHPHIRDENITFENTGHVYFIDGCSNDTVSTTTLIKTFTSPFPGRFICRRMVNSPKFPNKPTHSEYKQYVVDTEGQRRATDDIIEDILKHWRRKGEEACRLGTNLHNSIDEFYNDIPVDLESTKELKLFCQFNKDYTAKGFVPYRTEWFIYDDTDRICGAIDCVMFRPSDGTYHIFDWKRSKKIKKSGNRMKYPLLHLRDCNFMIYSLQLNVYKYILEVFYGITVHSMCLVILHPSQHTYQIEEVPMLQNEVKDMILEYKKMKSTKPVPISDYFPSNYIPIRIYFP